MTLSRRGLLGAPAFLQREAFSIGVFEADVTPPIGSPVFTGYARKVVDPLVARGIVLRGSQKPVVVVSVDWCEIRNDSYDLWRGELAKAAGTDRERVLVSCVHQHDAPYTDSHAQLLLEKHGCPDKLCDPEFERRMIARVCGTLAGAKPGRVTHYGTGEARVREVASNRRYVLPGGRVSFGRTSATRDPAISAMPEGLIDPWLKTLSFWDGSTPLAALSCYSTHPMSYYGQADVSWDFVGMARSRIRGQGLSIYCSGASGDTMAGKYNDGNPANRPVLAERISQAMNEAWQATRRHPMRKAAFRCAKLRFEPRRTRGFLPEEMQQAVADQTASRRKRFNAALGKSWLRRLEQARPIDMPCLDLEGACVLLLPAEAFVQYQLWAQEMRKGGFVLTLGYGECAPGYIPTNREVNEGYDDDYCWVDMASAEERMRSAMNEALNG